MTAFKDILPTLPSIDHIARLELIDTDGNTVATVDNRPGKQGSLRVYHKIFQDHGKLDSAGAQQGLHMFAEHVADAERHPGKHPNIDRLFEIIRKDLYYAVKIIPQNP